MKKLVTLYALLALAVPVFTRCVLDGDDDYEDPMFDYPPSYSYPFDYAFPPGFYGFYTRIDSREPWEGQSKNRTGDHTDVVVHIGNGSQVVFWHASSYLPFWKTENGHWYFDEIVSRTGDGSGIMPDRINRYAHVRIIENSPDQVVVHWRYVPDFSRAESGEVVDEYFTILPTGHVTRTIRQSAAKIDDWNDPRNVTVQELELLPDGIGELSLTVPDPQGLPGDPVDGNPVLGPVVSVPVAHWDFNEGLAPNYHVTEELTGRAECAIHGHDSLWKAGVSGTALQFDGYHSAVVLPAGQGPVFDASMTVEAWFALGAYPQMDWAPIIHQSDWGRLGYYLGVNPEGHLGFHVSVSGTWHSVIHTETIETWKWIQVAATFDQANNSISLFINGQQVETEPVPGGSMAPAAVDLMIGLNNRTMPAVDGRLWQGSWPTVFGIEGLIDEVRLYDAPLTGSEILESFQNFDPGIAIGDSPDMQPRVFPAHPGNNPAAAFGAEYTKLNYHDGWDSMWRVSDHADVVVNFDLSPVRMVFWRGLSYAPALITENGIWAGDQSSENWMDIDDPGEAEGCCEHMSDKQCRHSHVRVIENTEARVVVHWRYGLVDSRYVFPRIGPRSGWGDWADEYWTIYPDAVAVRHLARGMIWHGSWTEALVYNQPGTYPEDNLNAEAYTVVNGAGQSYTYSWEHSIPDTIPIVDPVIGMVNTKSVYRPFMVLPLGSKVSPCDWGSDEGAYHFNWHTHYPISQIISDGWGALAPDRATHTSLVWPTPGKEDYVMYGLTDQAADSLMPLFRSWETPAELTEPAGCDIEGYDKTQRAYVLFLNEGGAALSFKLNGSADSPIVNPCFVVRNWGRDSTALVEIDGVPLVPGPEFRQGIVRHTDGVQTLVTWIKTETTLPVDVSISP